MYDLKANFAGFLEFLNDNNKRIAYFQLPGKIEDFLVKEFCYFVYTKSKGTYAAVVNLGDTRKRKKWSYNSNTEDEMLFSSPFS